MIRFILIFYSVGFFFMAFVLALQCTRECRMPTRNEWLAPLIWPYHSVYGWWLMFKR